MEKKWEDMTPEEKKQQRFEWWLEPKGVEFVSKDAERAYKQRAQRFIDVYQVREPDRVPVSLPVGSMPAYLDGTDLRTVMYDYERMKRAWEKFNSRFEMDTFASPGVALPGRVYDLLDVRLYHWPGRGLPKDATGIQFVEGEYMKADEYDDLIRNPSDFWQRTYMPRIFGALESWKNLQPFTSIIELPAAQFMPYSRPDVQESLRKLIAVGDELARWSEVIGRFGQMAMASGFPMTRGAMAKAPFDTLGDTLRGTQGIMMDMFRRPDKLLEALDVITDVTIDATIAAANASRGLFVFFPLHKGADGWMSDKQFQTFYWPSLKKVVDALVGEGIIASLFAEGGYNTRLETVNDFPKGAVAWVFDKTDMARAKKVLGDRCCIAGNVPTSMLVTAKPADVKEYCRKLIEVCAPGGGYILSGGASIDNGKPDNFKAMMEAAREYGVYRK